MTAVTTDHLEALRRLTLNDEHFVASVLVHYGRVGEYAGDDFLEQVIDDRTKRLVDLAALIAVGGGPVVIEVAVSDALGAGATDKDIVNVLLCIAPAVGSARIVDCAPHIAAAIGYDMDVDFEELRATPKVDCCGGG